MTRKQPIVRSLLYTTLAIGTILIAPPRTLGQEEITRKVISKIQPAYPELAHRMNISGTVKLLVDVAPNGAVTNVKVMGGHPLLIVSAEEAVRKWKYAPAAQATTGRVELTFSSGQ
jgi:TonB family protein